MSEPAPPAPTVERPDLTIEEIQDFLKNVPAESRMVEWQRLTSDWTPDQMAGELFRMFTHMTPEQREQMMSDMKAMEGKKEGEAEEGKQEEKK